VWSGWSSLPDVCYEQSRLPFDAGSPPTLTRVLEKVPTRVHERDKVSDCWRSALSPDRDLADGADTSPILTDADAHLHADGFYVARGFRTGAVETRFAAGLEMQRGL
jgi:hypothetical protein